MILFTLSCIAVLAYCLKGKDASSKLDELKNTDWKIVVSELFSTIKDYANQIGRSACAQVLKLWFVLLDSKTTILEKALICGAILYVVSKGSIIPASVYKLLGLADEGIAIAYVVNKVQDKLTPDIENKVMEVLDELFGPVYTVTDVKE